MTDLVRPFRALVVPRLKQRFDISAALIAAGASTFSTEVAAMQRQAWNMGGSGIPADAWDDFSGWIGEQIIAAVTRLEIRQTIPGYQRDIIAVFVEQEQIIADQREEITRLRADLATAFVLAASLAPEAV
jgi:hypothetical protein